MQDIVGRCLPGESSEYTDDMVDELMLIVAPDADSRTLADCKKRFADSVPMPFGGFPRVKEVQEQAEKPQKAKAIRVQINKMGSKDDQFKTLVSEIVTEALKKEQRPGGLLFRK